MVFVERGTDKLGEDVADEFAVGEFGVGGGGHLLLVCLFVCRDFVVRGLV